jgi:hypothetical protein
VGKKKKHFKKIVGQKYFKNLWEIFYFFKKKNRIAAVLTDAKRVKKCKN